MFTSFAVAVFNATQIWTSIAVPQGDDVCRHSATRRAEVGFSKLVLTIAQRLSGSGVNRFAQVRSYIRNYFKPLTMCRRTKIVTVGRMPPNISERIGATCNRQRLYRCEFSLCASFRSDHSEDVILE